MGWVPWAGCHGLVVPPSILVSLYLPHGAVQADPSFESTRFQTLFVKRIVLLNSAFNLNLVSELTPLHPGRRVCVLEEPLKRERAARVVAGNLSRRCAKHYEAAAPTPPRPAPPPLLLRTRIRTFSKFPSSSATRAFSTDRITSSGICAGRERDGEGRRKRPRTLQHTTILESSTAAVKARPEFVSSPVPQSVPAALKKERTSSPGG